MTLRSAVLVVSDCEDADNRPPNPWGVPEVSVNDEAGAVAVDTVEEMRPAGTAVLIGATSDIVMELPSAPGVSSGRRESPEEAPRHHSRAHGPGGVVEGP